MAETMVRASGGFSRQNMADAKAKGKREGIAETKKGNAQRGMVLSMDDYGNTITFTNSEMVNAEGMMPNRGNTNITLNSRSETAIIPEGYHKGSGVVSVKNASGRRDLLASERGVVDIGAKNDIRYVDATAPTNAARSEGYSSGYSAGYSAGDLAGQETAKNSVMNSGGCSIAFIGAENVKTSEHIQSTYTNTTSYTMNIIITAVSSRYRGDGYSNPVIRVTNATNIDYRATQFSDDTSVQTNVSMATGTYSLAAGVTMSFEIGVNDNSGAVTYTIAYKRAT